MVPERRAQKRNIACQRRIARSFRSYLARGACPIQLVEEVVTVLAPSPKAHGRPVQRPWSVFQTENERPTPPLMREPERWRISRQRIRHSAALRRQTNVANQADTKQPPAANPELAPAHHRKKPKASFRSDFPVLETRAQTREWQFPEQTSGCFVYADSGSTIGHTRYDHLTLGSVWRALHDARMLLNHAGTRIADNSGYGIYAG